MSHNNKLSASIRQLLRLGSALGFTAALAACGGGAQPSSSSAISSVSSSSSAPNPTSSSSSSAAPISSSSSSSVAPVEPREPYVLDCGPYGDAYLSSGPPQNRVNYIILGDGYTQAELDTTLKQHIEFGLGKRFNTEIGQPFGRYKNFINVCVLKVASSQSGVCGNTPFGSCGDDQSRLCNFNNNAVNRAVEDYLPADIEVDWLAVVLNNSRWWNAGGYPMCWSGGNDDADGAELHEAGHAFHQLADEYGGTSGGCNNEYAEVNSTADPLASAGKWDKWVGYNQAGATGEQGMIQGSRYCDNGQYRPSQNSMMNLLFGDNPNTSFNSVSREQIVFSIWRIIENPYDSVSPEPGAVTNPGNLVVRTIDPEVISVDWSVNGQLVAEDGGEVFNIAQANLSPGTYTITARTYDNAGDDLVRYRDGTCPPSNSGYYCHRTGWNRASKDVTWQVTVQ